MSRVRWLLSLALLPALAVPAPAADDKPISGSWKLSYALSPSAEITNWIIKLEPKDGQVTGTLSGNPRLKSTLESVRVDGDRIRLVIKGATGEQVFEGRLAGKDAKEVRGAFGDDRRLYLARLVRTEDTELDPKTAVTRTEVPEPMKQVAALSSKPAMLRFQASKATDPNEKARLLKESQQAAEEVQKEAPKYYQEVLDKHGDSPAVFDAGASLLWSAARTKASPEQVGKWAKTMRTAAEPYGPLWQNEVGLIVAERLARQKEHAATALEYARQAEKGLGDKASPARQVRVLKALAVVQQTAGQTDQARATEARLEKLEAALDKEYHAKELPFKPEAFERKGRKDRTVVMELFTGAQCPPCIAADVAFDALVNTYKPADVIFLQYHMHIPGPDPLTNADTEARWDYYQKQFPEGIRGTPSTVFNGRPEAGGGGGMDRAEVKYKEYRAIIDPLLDKDAGATLKVNAVQQGDRIAIRVTVGDLADPGAGKKLRLVLAEETVRYVGSNGLRFHHQVVRAFPGGVDGLALTEKNSKHSVMVNLGEVRQELTRYLDDYSASKSPFPKLDRPLDLKDLRVIAIVQDDKTKEILQGSQIEVAEK